jgi:hypothetical protein
MGPQTRLLFVRGDRSQLAEVIRALEGGCWPRLVFFAIAAEARQ